MPNFTASHTQSVLNCMSVKFLQLFSKFLICYVKLLGKKSCTHLLQVVNQCCVVHIKKETNEWYPKPCGCNFFKQSDFNC